MMTTMTTATVTATAMAMATAKVMGTVKAMVAALAATTTTTIGSTPANPKLYARVVQAAKDKFDVYPSAVANSWVVQEYKRRGGTYKSDSQPTSKSIWDGSFDPKELIK